jgi:AcrR family transcriptional regulator
MKAEEAAPTAVEKRGGARRAILDAAQELLERPGRGGAGLEAVAARAGYSRQAIYRHFGSRAGLLKAVLADIDERGRAEDAVAGVLAAGGPAAVLDALDAWWSEYVAGFAGVARRVYAGRVDDPALAAAWEDRMRALLGVCELVSGRLSDQRALREELDRGGAAELLWGILSIPLWDQLVNDLGWTRERYRERVGLLAASLIRPPGSG